MPISLNYGRDTALQSGGVLVGLFGGLFGSGTGAGIAFLYVICAVCMLLVSLVGFFIVVVRHQD